MKTLLCNKDRDTKFSLQTVSAIKFCVKKIALISVLHAIHCADGLA